MVKLLWDIRTHQFIFLHLLVGKCILATPVFGSLLCIKPIIYSISSIVARNQNAWHLKTKLNFVVHVSPSVCICECECVYFNKIKRWYIRSCDAARLSHLQVIRGVMKHDKQLANNVLQLLAYTFLSARWVLVIKRHAMTRIVFFPFFLTFANHNQCTITLSV